MSASSDARAVGNSDSKNVRFSTADYPPHKRVEALHEIFGRNLQKVHVEPLNGESESFHTEVTLRRMPGLSLYTASRSAAISRRSREFIEHDDTILIDILLLATNPSWWEENSPRPLQSDSIVAPVQDTRAFIKAVAPRSWRETHATIGRADKSRTFGTCVQGCTETGGTCV